METQQYINTLKKKTKSPISVSMRQALCHYLYNNKIPCLVIHNILGMNRKNVYNSIYKTRDMLDVSDKIMKKAYSELESHSIVVRPCIIECGVFTKHVGYKLIIDGIIY